MLDLTSPFVEDLLAEGYAQKITGIADTYEHGAPLRVGKSHNRLNGCLVKS